MVYKEVNVFVCYFQQVINSKLDSITRQASILGPSFVGWSSLEWSLFRDSIKLQMPVWKSSDWLYSQAGHFHTFDCIPSKYNLYFTTDAKTHFVHSQWLPPTWTYHNLHHIWDFEDLDQSKSWDSKPNGELLDDSIINQYHRIPTQDHESNTSSLNHCTSKTLYDKCLNWLRFLTEMFFFK